MIQIRDVTKDVADGSHRRRDAHAIKRIAVHRCGVDLVWSNLIGYDAITICDAFADRDPHWVDTVAKATRCEIPYTLMLGGNLGPDEYDGVIWQTLPMLEIGAHARRWNHVAIGVAVIADPRVRPLSDKQHANLVELLSDLTQAFKIDPLAIDDDGSPFLAGHTELPGASKDPNKQCPGKYLPMANLRQQVAEASAKANKTRALDRLVAAGMVA
jgi:hypothetical protein